MTDEAKASPQCDVELAWKMICDLRSSEQHFNEMKAKCRTLASTWLLAAFGAMGFLLSKELSINLPTEVVILGVGLAASTGLLLLWVLDLLVYHRLLDASFLEALEIEKKYPILPQVRRGLWSPPKNRPFEALHDRCGQSQHCHHHPGGIGDAEAQVGAGA